MARNKGRPTAGKQQNKPAPKASSKPVQTTKRGASASRSSQGDTEDSEEADEDDEDYDENGDDEEDEEDADEEDEDDDEEDEDDDGFEDQGSSSDDNDDEADDDESDDEKVTRKFVESREKQLQRMREDGSLQIASHLHIDDLSSDDEEAHNTIGNVPLRWYEEYDHIGYTVDGQKIIKQNKTDGIDDAIAAKDDPNYGRTVYDAYNDRKVVLSDRELEIIRRMQSGAFAHPEFDAHADLVETFTSEKMIHSLGNDQEPKSRFLPSKWEKMKVLKIMKGIKEGRIQVDKKPDDKPEVFQMWFEDDQEAAVRKGPAHVQAPKMILPGHAESYNPPEEYLFTEEEKRAWLEMDPSDRETNFIPQKFNSLRDVCGYSNFVRERFERCLDLYLCPRVNKRRLNIDPESLVPQLPKPRDLRPFPNTLALLFNGHKGRVRSLSMDPLGQFMASGSEDHTVRLWEVETGRCLHTWDVGAVVHKVEWCPNKDHHVIAVAAAKKMLLIATGTGNGDETDITNALLGGENDDDASTVAAFDVAADDENVTVVDTAEADIDDAARKARMPVKWTFHASKGRHGRGVRMVLHHSGSVTDVAWHYKGDYLSTVVPAADSSSVLIHQISKRSSQNPFSKKLGSIQTVSFHPSKPFFFLATQTHVRVYNLVQQAMVKKLNSGVKWISSLQVHPSGDHVLVGSYDRRLCWFDLDLSSTPFKTLKYHEKATRAVGFHKRYPLMASASDDGTIHIFHAMVYSDLIKNPLIVPLKILRGHEVTGGLGVMALAFHPTLPWIASGGADNTIRLFQNIH
ncbi:Aste57867_8414 [Aphanomyces stellatus]|uniref:Ribosome biogenesis protein BOP1 homolog n=1 Tax=Aphanomyces stellatus TaxID=120398 RepID=A0A485KK94_9STRA|nr:hypothetical protein As57867_008382 [Aphanomyces stellatus]VFT85300.1 Aste57867_8414 [Aphanomyces stellatus]